MWPDPDDLLIKDQKLLTHMRLAIIAEARGYRQPEIRAVGKDQVVSYANSIARTPSSQVVMKRCMSHGKKHLICSGINPDYLGSILEDEHFWGKTTTFRSPVWFIQPYLPLMETIGQARAFVVHGILQGTVWTELKPDGSSWGLVHQMRPLHKYG